MSEKPDCFRISDFSIQGIPGRLMLYTERYMALTLTMIHTRKLTHTADKLPRGKWRNRG